MTDEAPMRLWVVEDGERHIVAARDPDEAKRIVAKSFDYESVKAYEADMGEVIVTLHSLVEHAVVVLESEADYKSMPKGGILRITVSYPYSTWADMPAGLLSTTAY